MPVRLRRPLRKTCLLSLNNFKDDTIGLEKMVDYKDNLSDDGEHFKMAVSLSWDRLSEGDKARLGHVVLDLLQEVLYAQKDLGLLKQLTLTKRLDWMAEYSTGAVNS